jgi:hypothetical protein
MAVAEMAAMRKVLNCILVETDGMGNWCVLMSGNRSWMTLIQACAVDESMLLL